MKSETHIAPEPDATHSPSVIVEVEEGQVNLELSILNRHSANTYARLTPDQARSIAADLNHAAEIADRRF